MTDNGEDSTMIRLPKVMAALYLTLRGTPIMYYGEEIAMKTTPATRKEDVKDPIGPTRMAEGKRPRRGTHTPCNGTR